MRLISRKERPPLRCEPSAAPLAGEDDEEAEGEDDESCVTFDFDKLEFVEEQHQSNQCKQA